MITIVWTLDESLSSAVAKVFCTRLTLPFCVNYFCCMPFYIIRYAYRYVMVNENRYNFYGNNRISCVLCRWLIEWFGCWSVLYQIAQKLSVVYIVHNIYTCVSNGRIPTRENTRIPHYCALFSLQSRDNEEKKNFFLYTLAWIVIYKSLDKMRDPDIIFRKRCGTMRFFFSCVKFFMQISFIFLLGLAHSNEC